jgi:hypothetical protein
MAGNAANSWGQTVPAPPGEAAKPSAVVSTLPRAQPTAQTATGADQSQTAAPAARHIEVEYSQGKLSVVASNASLNEILREVAQKTGIKITGGVADERVFGGYGPASSAAVLAALLDGTSSNMLLVDDASGHSELILTARNGGPTPPNPNAGQQDNDDQGNGAGRYVPPIRPYQPPTANGRGPVGFIPGQQPNGGDQGESGAPPTPQQIYEQLQRSQQKQNQGTPPQ